MVIKSYKDLVVWQKSSKLVLLIYELTERFPKSEAYGLTSQMRRSAISIPSNIAEGSMRGTRKDYRNFLFTAFGSGAELETQLAIAKQLPFSKNLNYTQIDELLLEIMKMLNVLIKSLSAVQNPFPKNYKLTAKT